MQIFELSAADQRFNHAIAAPHTLSLTQWLLLLLLHARLLFHLGLIILLQHFLPLRRHCCGCVRLLMMLMRMLPIFVAARC